MFERYELNCNYAKALFLFLHHQSILKFCQN
jgi:hypothetical protein